MKIGLLFVMAWVLTGAAAAQAGESEAVILARLESAPTGQEAAWMKDVCAGGRAEAHRAQLGGGRRHLVVEADACGEESLAILVFGETAPGSERWSYEQKIVLMERYGVRPRVSFPTLARKGEQEIMVERVMVDWGTGIQQYDRIILKMVDGRLTTVFEEPEEVSVHMLGSEQYMLEERRLFTVERAVDGDGVMRLHERQMLRGRSVGKARKGKRAAMVGVERQRDCSWDEALRHFVCVEDLSGAK